MNWRLDFDFDYIDVPEDPILSNGPVGDIVSDRVPPRRNTAVPSQEIAVARLQPGAGALLDWLPLERRVEARGQSLENFPAGHSEQERVVGGGEILAVAALQPDNGVGIGAGEGNELDAPSGVLGGSVPILSDGFLVVVGEQVLVVVAPEPDHLGVAEEIHAGTTELAGGDVNLQ